MREASMLEQPYTFKPNTLLRLPQVKGRTGLSRSEIYRRIAVGTFPAPIKLGERARAWPEHEITAWIDARIAARDAGRREQAETQA
jgi:prophage regulatory protein